jgi:hypothetical protein
VILSIVTGRRDLARERRELERQVALLTRKVQAQSLALARRHPDDDSAAAWGEDRAFLRLGRELGAAQRALQAIADEEKERGMVPEVRGC